MKIEIDGVVKTATEWGRQSGLSRQLIHYRYKSGLRGLDLLSPPEINTKGKGRYKSKIRQQFGVDMVALSKMFGFGHADYHHITPEGELQFTINIKAPNDVVKALIELYNRCPDINPMQIINNHIWMGIQQIKEIK